MPVLVYNYESFNYGAFVYRLGRKVLNLERGVQLP